MPSKVKKKSVRKPSGRPRGRPPGAKNKKTIAAENLLLAGKSPGLVPAVQPREEIERPKPLAKEELEKWMHYYAGLATRYQLGSPTQDLKLFERYSMIAIRCAESLAPYQSARFAAVAVQVGGGPSVPKTERRTVVLNIFDDEGNQTASLTKTQRVEDDVVEAEIVEGAVNGHAGS